MKKLLGMMLMLLCFVACSEENGDLKDIVLDKGTSTSQTIYADETSSAKGISFVANGAWTAVVNEIAASKAAGRVDWILLNQYEGGAGSYTLTLTVQPNKTGADRKAEIVISCGDTQIKIFIEQKSTTSEGEELNPEVPQSQKMISEIVTYNKNEKGEYEKSSQITFKYDDKGRLIQQHHDFYSNEQKYEEIKSWDYKLSYTKDAEGNDIVKSDCAVATFGGKNWTHTEILTLDASGKAVKLEDKAVNGNQPVSYQFYYNDKNQHIRTDKKGKPGDSDSNFTINATWGVGNLLTGGEIPAFSSKTEVSYNESILNDASLDLAFANMTNSYILSEMRAEGFVFQSLDCWGARIKNMPSKIVEKQKGNVDDTYIFDYQLDKDNKITGYTLKYDMGEDKVDIKYLQ